MSRRPYAKTCLSLWERWHAAGVTERVFFYPLRPKSQISASSPKGGEPSHGSNLHCGKDSTVYVSCAKMHCSKGAPVYGGAGAAKQRLRGCQRKAPSVICFANATSPINVGGFGAEQERTYSPMGMKAVWNVPRTQRVDQ